MNTIKAKVHLVGELKTIPSKNGGEPFKKRELVLDASRFDPYTGEKSGDNFVVIEFSNKRCEELDKVSKGDLVSVSFVLQGREYTDQNTGTVRYFTSIVGVSIIVERKEPTTPREPLYTPPVQESKSISNELPF